MQQMIKRFAGCTVALLWAVCLAAQPALNRVEYYLDTDPGYGNATVIGFTAGATNLSDIALNINPATITTGVHVLGIRARSANGAWSLDNKWLFVKPFSTVGGAVPNLSRVEYYIDNDPGYGNATNISFSPGTNLTDIAINIDPATVSAGVHVLGIRAKDANGAWSLDNKWLFVKPFSTGGGAAPNLSRVEYYIDADPGYGNATALAISPVTNLADLTVNLDPAAFTNGVHVLGIRARDANGAWSLDNKWLFVKSIASATAPNISRVEYYIDTDPGYGNGTEVATASITNLNDAPLSVNISGLAVGNHKLFIRSRDANGAWSLDNKWEFTVTSAVAAPSVTLNSVSRKTLCAGDTFTAGYDAKGNFNTGNVFNIELSDAAGSFAAPVVIGSVSSKLSGVVQCVLPASLVTGSGYRVRAVSSSPAITSNASADAFTVNAIPAVPTITPGGPTTFCAGGSVTLTASSATSYLWNTGATTQSINVSTGGNYTVTVKNAAGCSNISVPTTVTVNPLPNAIITPGGPTTFCQGGSVTLTSSNGSSYLWSTGATTQSINVSTAGNYTVTVTNVNGCSKTSDATAVTVNPLPNANITPGGPTTFCQGGSVTLTANNSSSYLWSTGATTRSITVGASGSYTVTVTNANGCSKASDATVVTVNPLPTATITPGGPTTFCQGGSVTLTASAASSYLWSNGATTQSITVSTSGNYTVAVTNASGCSSTSAATAVNVVANPTPTITSSGSTTNVCPGKTVTLDAGAGYTTYLWNTGATTRTIVVSAAGSYSVTVTNATGCSGTSAPTLVTYQGCPKPTNPVNSNITATSARLSWTPPASCAIGYQLQYRRVSTTAWTTLQFAASSRNITGLLPNTTYEWRVQTGCQQNPPIGSGNIIGPNFTTLSAAIAGAGMKQSTGGGLKAILFPNPARDIAIIQLSGITGAVTIRVTDMAGKTVWQSPASTARQLQVPVAQLSSGTYLVTVIGATESTVLKLVKE